MDEATPELDDEAVLDEALGQRAEKAAEQREARRSQQDSLNSVDVGNAIAALAPMAANGIVGGLAWDLVKKAIPKRRHGAKPPRAQDLLKDLALHAVREQCHRYDLPVPEVAAMKIRWGYTKAGATAYVSCRSPEMSAKVVIPHEDRETRGVEVHLYGVTPRSRASRHPTD